MNVAQETLGFRRAGLSPALSLLMSAFALPIPPAALSGHLRRRTERSSTTANDPLIALPPRSPRFAREVCEADIERQTVPMRRAGLSPLLRGEAHTFPSGVTSKVGGTLVFRRRLL